tara:strand:- start:809 stop:1033 length:225 start_codon:yes stop_codon:yes gene_type:complete
MIIISKNTEAFLSTEGYYGYYYRDSTKRIVFEKDVEGNELTHWRNEKGWKAILLRPENLDQYPNRPCNVVWIKE